MNEPLLPKTYVCAGCNGTFSVDDEAETLLELAQLLTTATAHECHLLCDDCGPALLTEFGDG